MESVKSFPFFLINTLLLSKQALVATGLATKKCQQHKMFYTKKLIRHFLLKKKKKQPIKH